MITDTLDRLFGAAARELQPNASRGFDPKMSVGIGLRRTGGDSCGRPLSRRLRDAHARAIAFGCPGSSSSLRIPAEASRWAGPKRRPKNPRGTRRCGIFSPLISHRMAPYG